jgi:hypothetical protein
VSALLALTDSAVEAVKQIVSSSEETSETGGVRLVAERVGTQTNQALHGEKDGHVVIFKRPIPD